MASELINAFTEVRQELIQEIEKNLRALIGTGLDLYVSRGTFVDNTYIVHFQAITPGCYPKEGWGTVYEVSKYRQNL